MLANSPAGVRYRVENALVCGFISDAKCAFITYSGILFPSILNFFLIVRSIIYLERYKRILK